MPPHKRHTRTNPMYSFIYLFMKRSVLNCKPLMTTGQCPRQAAVSALPTLCCVGMLGNWRIQGWGLQTLSFVGKPICPFRYRFSCESFSQGCKSSNCLFLLGSNLNSAIDIEENVFVQPLSDRKGQK